MMRTDERNRVSAAVGVMADVEAETDPVVRVDQEPLDLLLVLDVGLRVRMEDNLEPVPRCRLPDLVGRRHELSPGAIVQIGRGEQLTREQVGVDVVDQDEVAAPELRDQLARPFDLFAHLLPAVGVLEREHREGPGDLELAALELPLELRRIGGKVAVRAELDPAVAGRRDLVEKTLRGGLVRVVGEPDAPRVGCAPESDGHP